MIKLKGDKDGFAGVYSAEGKTWTVEKYYYGRGVGARWTVSGPYFKDRSAFNFSDIANIVANWKAQGVSGPL